MFSSKSVTKLEALTVPKKNSKQTETYSALQRQFSLYIPFLGIVLSPNFHIHVSVSDLYVPRIGPHTRISSSR
jgi:hypothetical protein